MLYFVDIGMLTAAPFGIEKAQIRRQRFLEDLSIPYRYVVLDYNPNVEQLSSYRDSGYHMENVQLLWQAFTDLTNEDLTYSYRLSDFLADLGEEPQEVRKLNDRELVYKMTDGTTYLCLLMADGQTIFLVKYYCENSLKEVRYYFKQKYLTVGYSNEESRGVCYSEPVYHHYHNRDGSVGLEMQFLKNDYPVFRLQGNRLTFSELLERYFELQQITEEDTIVIERIEERLGDFIKKDKKAKLGYYLHEDHIKFGYDGKCHPHIHRNLSWVGDGIDFILSTAVGQPEDLRNYIKEHFQRDVRVYLVPVMHVDQRNLQPSNRKNNSFLSVSNLTEGKCIDDSIEAVVLARKEVPDLTYDIYGDGKMWEKLSTLIAEHKAQGYIRLKGYNPRMDSCYDQYDAYLASSKTEAFATTLIEAMNHGVALLARDIPYAHQAYVDDGENGLLVGVENYVSQMATAIVRYCQQEDKEAMSRAAYQKSLNLFSYERVREAWECFVKQEHIR